MKVLLLIFHPDLSKSRVNKTWGEQLQSRHAAVTVKDMYEIYPNFQFDVKKEQRDLVSHDKIVIQFPIYWYMCTPLLKKWLDDVLEYGFAYGTDNKLKGKDLQLIVSAGGSKASYKSVGILDLLKPFQMTVNYLEMNFMIPFWQYEVGSSSQELITQYGAGWSKRLLENTRLEENESVDWITVEGLPYLNHNK